MKYSKRVPQSGKPKIAKKSAVRPASLDGRLTDLGSILGVWAHPDDESFMMAGLLAAAVENGQTVACITATKGEEGVQNEKKWPKAKLGEIRTKELADAFKILGINHHHWLNYYDGKVNKISDDEGVNVVLSYIKKYKSDTIFTFPPDGITGHDDHKTVSRWAREAIKSAVQQTGKSIALYYSVDTQEKYDDYFREIDEKFNIYFNIDQPVLVPLNKCDIVFKLSSKLAQKKMLALKVQPSQTEGMFEEFGEQLFSDSLKTETFVRADPQNPAKWPLT